jgi:hypothetical protein
MDRDREEERKDERKRNEECVFEIRASCSHLVCTDARVVLWVKVRVCVFVYGSFQEVFFMSVFRHDTI